MKIRTVSRPSRSFFLKLFVNCEPQRVVTPVIRRTVSSAMSVILVAALLTPEQTLLTSITPWIPMMCILNVTSNGSQDIFMPIRCSACSVIQFHKFLINASFDNKQTRYIMYIHILYKSLQWPVNDRRKTKKTVSSSSALMVKSVMHLSACVRNWIPVLPERSGGLFANLSGTTMNHSSLVSLS